MLVRVSRVSPDGNVNAGSRSVVSLWTTRDARSRRENSIVLHLRRVGHIRYSPIIVTRKQRVMKRKVRGSAPRMVTFRFHLPKMQHEHLLQMAERADCSAAELVRRMIEVHGRAEAEVARAAEAAKERTVAAIKSASARIASGEERAA